MSPKAMARTISGFVGIASTLWWIALFVRPEWRAPFLWRGLPESSFLAFLPADLGVFIPAAVLFWLKGVRSAWLVFVGASLYSALLTFGLCALHGGGWLGAWLMAALVAAQLFLEWRLRAENSLPNH